jgi:hypothetical protein
VEDGWGAGRASDKNGHPDTLTEMNNLALALKNQDFTSIVIFLMEDCCRLGSVVVGPQHSNIVLSPDFLIVWQLGGMDISEQSNS